jgi:hypothetical protein
MEVTRDYSSSFLDVLGCFYVNQLGFKPREKEEANIQSTYGVLDRRYSMWTP